MTEFKDTWSTVDDKTVTFCHMTQASVCATPAVPKPDVPVKPNASSQPSAPPALADSREPSPPRSAFVDKDGEKSPYAASQPHSGSENDAPMEYVIDKVVDHRIPANGEEFLVK